MHSLDLRPDDTGELATQELNCDSVDRFTWQFDPGSSELVLTPTLAPFQNEFIAGGRFRVEQHLARIDGQAMELLRLGVYHQAEVLEHGATRIEYPEGWSFLELLRSAESK